MSSTVFPTLASSPTYAPADAPLASSSPGQAGPPPHMIGISVGLVIVLVGAVCLGVWVCVRRRRRQRVEARGMRQVGRVDGTDHFATIDRQAPRPSRWEDDSEADMVATDGSTLTRTLSTQTASTITTILDHPGYTYKPSSRLPGPAVSPFNDPAPPSAVVVSPFADGAAASLADSRASIASTLPSYSSPTDPSPAYTYR
jgi:hypothetical protein